MASLDDLAFEVERDIGTLAAFFPVLPRLGNRWAARRPWEGKVIGLNLHITPISASFLQELSLGGATLVVSAANPGTTDAGTVHLLRGAGIEVYTGGDLEDRHRQVLAHQPSLLVDTSFDLLRAADRLGPGHGVQAGVVLNASGLRRLREHGKPPWPVLNLYEGRLRDVIESRHGIGGALWEAVTRLTGMHLAGRQVAVLGYGPVGRGLADQARHNGMAVEVVETDPIRRLYAHYDGFPTPPLRDALRRAHLVATATGQPRVVGIDDLAEARDRVVLFNAGTGGEEIDLQAIKRAAERVDHIAEGVASYKIDENQVIVLGNGHPLNIVTNSGSAEPVLLQFALLGLALEWLAPTRLTAGEHRVPETIEDETAREVLAALALSA
jgi:adenosylhomocysteinase